MKSSLPLVMSSLMFSALLSGCNGSSSKSDTVTTNFSLSGSTESSQVASTNFQKALNLIIPSAVAVQAPVLTDSTGATVTLSQAWIVVKRVQFKTTQTAEASEGEGNTYNYKGPFFIDLLSEEKQPFGDIELPEAGLRRVKMLLHKSNNESETAPDELSGKSIFLSGTVNGHQFTYSADDTTVFTIAGARAIVPEEGKDLMAVIRLADLLKKIDLSSITANTNITSAVSSRGATSGSACPSIHSQASDLYTCFIRGLAAEAKFGKDEDGNRDLGSSEDNAE